ncbi:hypothetical protein [Methanobacterium sp.]
MNNPNTNGKYIVNKGKDITKDHNQNNIINNTQCDVIWIFTGKFPDY